MRTTIETITPERATELLANNPHNRPLVASRVAALVHALESGQWRLTHQGIALAADGALLDGQHRLTAIVRTGVTVELQVSRMKDDVFDVIDTGRARGARRPASAAGVPGPQRSAALTGKPAEPDIDRRARPPAGVGALLSPTLVGARPVGPAGR
ncbi:hypothetical protein [Luteipulveratus halotolerans]|uniref:hypothetical protein n=1 Tax=Luteipulveratus halotolerans TaxID=1631356 RepID=UPI0012F74251|nr:hypothetical protein [Luteipulveratus halotolerans]